MQNGFTLHARSMNKLHHITHLVTPDNNGKTRYLMHNEIIAVAPFHDGITAMAHAYGGERKRFLNNREKTPYSHLYMRNPEGDFFCVRLITTSTAEGDSFCEAHKHCGHISSTSIKKLPEFHIYGDTEAATAL